MAPFLPRSGARGYSHDPPPSTVPAPRPWVRAHHHAQTNGAGKLSNGWILDGGISVYGPTTGYTTGDDGTGRFATYSCAGHGSTIFSTMNVEQSHSVGGLQVNGIDLPNTPVEVAPVA
jgi:hypothetical protein